MIESLKTLIAHTLQNECATFFAPIELGSADITERADCDEGLQRYAQELLNAHLYPLTAQGKLIRPLLVLLTAGSIGGERAVQAALPAALAVECVHTYSLVHDDLPCMDNDTLRRGKPTTHVVYGDAKALLVGDGLLTAAFEILSNANSAQALIKCLSKAIGARGMIFGQWLDISEANLFDSAALKWEIFHTIHINKTGKLFGACFEMGLLSALNSLDIYSSSFSMSISAENVNKEHSIYKEEDIRNMQKSIFQIGLDVGLSFQIADDILDTTQDSTALGKTAGKDAIQNKLTAVKILGLKEANEYADKCLNGAIQNLQSFMNTNFPNAFQKNNQYFAYLTKLLGGVLNLNKPHNIS